MDEASLEPVHVEAPVVAGPRSATWMETWTNVGAPTLFGLVVGALWQWKVQSTLAYGIPNPVQASLLMMLLCAPLFHRLLTQHPQKLWKEYALGVLLLGGFFSAVWMSGYGGFVCGGYLAVVVWIWVSTSWWRFHLPPFRLAIWHTFGVNIGALGGSIMMYGLLG